LATLRDQAKVYGPIASDPTLWRTLDDIGHPQRRKIARARAKTREHVWSLIAERHGQIPPSRVADRDLGKTIVIRMDASLVIAHSDKQLAARTYKGSWGHYPLMGCYDNTTAWKRRFQHRSPSNRGARRGHIRTLPPSYRQAVDAIEPVR